MNTRMLTEFVKESNRIEGIDRHPLRAEIHAHESLIHGDRVSVEDLEAFVQFVQPGAVIRDAGQCVSVGSHVPPPGGPGIVYALQELLHDISEDNTYETHCEYEKLHPFTDGNGRSGRALWLWQMRMHRPWDIKLGFLHAFYYQTLERS